MLVQIRGNKMQNLPKYPTREAMDKFNDLLQLHEDEYTQDWEIELADGRRLLEFIECYQKYAVSNEEKFTLMSLIIASCDDYLEDKTAILHCWQQVKALLMDNKLLFEPIIRYWSFWESGDEVEEHFNMTPLMREIPDPAYVTYVSKIMGVK